MLRVFIWLSLLLALSFTLDGTPESLAREQQFTLVTEFSSFRVLSFVIMSGVRPSRFVVPELPFAINS